MTLLAAVNPDTIKTLALGISGGSVLIALILMKVISSIIGKIVSLVVFVAIALAGFSQRQAISDCVDKVKDQVSSGASANPSVDTTCRFFGRDISINVDLP
jgi:hypothetical protein